MGDEHIISNTLLQMKSPPSPAPKQPTKCPLFCCFYAEFDIKVGPMICFQSPRGFMDREINISTDRVHDILAETFESFEDRSVPSSTEQMTDSASRDALGEPENEKDTRDPEGGLSIFDSTSEYIITGSELTGKIITLSTHDMHVMTRPTLISDERYERNALLFSVGIVLRRAADPRPFRPLISRLALSLRSMEIESRFLSKPALRQQVQPLLERVLASLNNFNWECNLLLSRSSALNLKLFHPPKPETSPVHDHDVPILLRKDVQLQMYDWDLAINWVILHIDGITNAQQISIKAEVDLEMVRACLRVLKHHGVIALVDMFMYSNRYEFTDKAASTLAGKEMQLLQEASNFIMKQPSLNSGHGISGTAPILGGGVGSGSDSSTLHHIGSPHQQTPSSSYPPRTMNLLGGSQRSSNFRYSMMTAQSLEQETLIDERCDEQLCVKSAVSELYCACSRNISFGDLWVSLTADVPSSLVLPNLQKTQGIKLNTTSQRQMPALRKSLSEEAAENDTFREQMESLALSPLENIQLDTLRKAIGPTPMDWTIFFKRFDHRRFISFGLVHGLLIRVHNYPFYPFTFPELQTQTRPLEETEARLNLKNEFMEEKAHKFARSVASVMDGTRCDDELACLFQKPFNNLVELVEKYGRDKVVSIYSMEPNVRAS